MGDELVTVVVADGKVLVVRFETAADREYIEATCGRLMQFVDMSRARAPGREFDSSGVTVLRCALQLVPVKHEIVTGDEAKELALRFVTLHGEGGLA